MTIDVTNTVKLLAKSTDETEGTFLLVAINRDGNWREYVIPATKLLDMKGIRGELVHRGHPLTDDQAYWQSVKESLYGNTDKSFHLITSPGWSGYSYISADDQLLGRLREGEIKPRFNPEYRVVSRSNSSVKSDEFREAITPILRSSSRIMLAACTAYSGYLAPFTEVKTSGFHFYGDSSIGKTTALSIAASIQLGVEGIASWDMTEKGFEEAAETHNHNVLILDELKLLDGDPRAAADKASKLVYTLAEQGGKRRSTKYETSRASWKLSILSAGERSLTEHAQDGRRMHMAGERVRLIDIPADTDSGFGIYEGIPEGYSIRDYVSHVASVADRYRGGARRFIKAISSMLQRKGDGYLKAKIAGLVDEFLSLPEFAELEGQKERILKRFGLAYAAGVIASEKRCIGLSEQELQAGLTVCALAALESVSSPAESQVKKLCQKLVLLDRKRTLLETKESSAEELKEESVIIHSFRDGAACYAVSMEYFDQVVDQAHSRSIKKLLAEVGILVKSKDGKNTQSLSKVGERRYFLNQEAVHRYLQKNEK